MHYWSLALSSKALKTVHAWQVFWLAPVIERLPVINWQLTIDSWQWIIQLSAVGCPLSENSGKSVVQYIFFNCQLFIINFQLKNELTAAGLFRIYTWFPFNCFPRKGVANQCGTKIGSLFVFSKLGDILFLSSWYERERTNLFFSIFSVFL